MIETDVGSDEGTVDGVVIGMVNGKFMGVNSITVELVSIIVCMGATVDEICSMNSDIVCIVATAGVTVLTSACVEKIVDAVNVEASLDASSIACVLTFAMIISSVCNSVDGVCSVNLDIVSIITAAGVGVLSSSRIEITVGILSVEESLDNISNTDKFATVILSVCTSTDAICSVELAMVSIAIGAHVGMLLYSCVGRTVCEFKVDESLDGLTSIMASACASVDDTKSVRLAMVSIATSADTALLISSYVVV